MSQKSHLGLDLLAITEYFLVFYSRSGQITEQETVANQPSPAPILKELMFFIIDPSKGWCIPECIFPNKREVVAIRWEIIQFY
jgi:hypothetical protein